LPPSTLKFSIRFPHYEPLFTFFESHIAKNIPSEWWLSEKAFQLPLEPLYLLQLKNIQHFLCEKFNEKMQDLVKNYGKMSREIVEGMLHTVFAILEEWNLCSFYTGITHGPTLGTINTFPSFFSFLETEKLISTNTTNTFLHINL
jgi:hypothetical protein